MLNNKRKAKADPKGNRAERRRAARQEPRRCDEKPTGKNDPRHGKPNPNRRRDEAVKLLYRGGAMVKQAVGKAFRYFIEFGGKVYKVRKNIALLIFRQRAVEAIRASAVKGIWKFLMNQGGKAWASQVLPVKAGA